LFSFLLTSTWRQAEYIINGIPADVSTGRKHVYDLTNFSLRDMTQCGSELRQLGDGAESMEGAARRVVEHLYGNFTDGSEKSCALVRCYKTHTLGDLPSDLHDFACAGLAGQNPDPHMKCLTLLATAGKEAAWNERKNSNGHQAIPLPSESVVAQIPMIAQLVKQFGLEISALVKSDPSLLADMSETAFNVFYVENAVGSPYIPAQDEFVVPYGIKSVVGFGGMIPTGDLFAVILFSTVHIPKKTAMAFESLALSAKLALLPFVGEKVFE
jgi:hypothetical protein